MGAAKLKRIFAAVIASALLLAACSSSGGLGGFRLRTVTTVPGPADTALPREIVLAVDASCGGELITAAERFCETANSLSKSGVIFTAKKSENPFADIKSGNAGLILAGGQKSGAFHPLFNVASERFRYVSYEDFSRTCNSEEVLSALSDSCGMRVFAAYYTGSNMLVSYAPLDKLIGGRASNQEEASPAASIYGITGSGTAEMLSPFCQSASEVASLSARIVSLSSTGAIVEFTPDELLRAGFADASAYEVIAEAAGVLGESFEENGDYPENIVFTRTSHSITPAWLIFAPSLYESLPPSAKAAAAEAAALMCGDIDKIFLDREQAAFDILMYENAGTLQEGLVLTRSRVMRSADERRGEVSLEERRLLNALARLR